jgi:hypothetical protein
MERVRNLGKRIKDKISIAQVEGVFFMKQNLIRKNNGWGYKSGKKKERKKS